MYLHCHHLEVQKLWNLGLSSGLILKVLQHLSDQVCESIRCMYIRQREVHDRLLSIESVAIQNYNNLRTNCSKAHLLTPARPYVPVKMSSVWRENKAGRKSRASASKCYNSLLFNESIQGASVCPNWSFTEGTTSMHTWSVAFHFQLGAKLTAL